MSYCTYSIVPYTHLLLLSLWFSTLFLLFSPMYYLLYALQHHHFGVLLPLPQMFLYNFYKSPHHPLSVSKGPVQHVPGHQQLFPLFCLHLCLS